LRYCPFCLILPNILKSYRSVSTSFIIIGGLTVWSPQAVALFGTDHHPYAERLKAKWGYIMVGGGAIALTWSANTFEIIALASRAFAFYYLLLFGSNQRE
jgi:hypothetical protein